MQPPGTIPIPPPMALQVRDKDPSCAICSEPPRSDCRCEVDNLNAAVAEAERAILRPKYQLVKNWVRDRAKDYVLATFAELRMARNESHAEYLQYLNRSLLENYNRPPSRRELAEAEARHQEVVDDDWKLCNDMYPDILAYYFSLIGVKRPKGTDSRVTDPPVTRPTIKRRPRAVVPRTGGGGGGGMSSAPMTAYEYYGLPPPNPPSQGYPHY